MLGLCLKKMSCLSGENLSLISSKKGFFNRLLQYSVILGQMNQISLLFQHQSFPSGMMVPVSVLLLYALSKSNKNMDPLFLQDFKSSLRDAVDARMGFLLRTKNNFLKAALLFPTMAARVLGCRESNKSLLFGCSFADRSGIQWDLRDF